MKCIVRPMELAEVEIATYLAYKEGWNPGLNDGLAFYNTDPNGFFIAEIDSRVVGCISAVNYNDEFGFIGFYVVEKEFRKSPAGTMLGRAALRYLKDINIGIDGVTERIENYKRLGFKYAYRNIRYEGVGGKYKFSNQIVPAKHLASEEIYDYDRQCFPAARHTFIDNWLSMVNAQSYAYFDEDTVKGFGTIRSCRKGYKIGPIFADSYYIANEIFKALNSFAVDELIYIDVPEVNQFAIDLAKYYDMRPMFETARMYSKEEPLVALSKIFAGTSFELG